MVLLTHCSRCTTLQSVRNHASRLAGELELALQSGAQSDAVDAAATDGDEEEAIGPLYTRPFSSSTDLGSTAPGVGWGGKSQVRSIYIPFIATAALVRDR